MPSAGASVKAQKLSLKLVHSIFLLIKNLRSLIKVSEAILTPYIVKFSVLVLISWGSLFFVNKFFSLLCSHLVHHIISFHHCHCYNIPLFSELLTQGVGMKCHCSCRCLWPLSLNFAMVNGMSLAMTIGLKFSMGLADQKKRYFDNIQIWTWL